MGSDLYYECFTLFVLSKLLIQRVSTCDACTLVHRTGIHTAETRDEYLHVQQMISQ